MTEDYGWGGCEDCESLHRELDEVKSDLAAAEAEVKELKEEVDTHSRERAQLQTRHELLLAKLRAVHGAAWFTRSDVRESELHKILKEFDNDT